MQMSMRRLTRLTNGFSKKLQNHEYMVALYALWYNFARIPQDAAYLARWQRGLKSSFGRWRTCCAHRCPVSKDRWREGYRVKLLAPEWYRQEGRAGVAMPND
jgi:hypothetical protein